MIFSQSFYENVHAKKLILLHLSLRDTQYSGKIATFFIKKHNQKTHQKMMALTSLYSKKDIAFFCENLTHKKMAFEKELMALGAQVAVGTVQHENEKDMIEVQKLLDNQLSKDDFLYLLSRITHECDKRKTLIEKIKIYNRSGKTYNPVIEF